MLKLTPGKEIGIPATDSGVFGESTHKEISTFGVDQIGEKIFEGLRRMMMMQRVVDDRIHYGGRDGKWRKRMRRPTEVFWVRWQNEI